MAELKIRELSGNDIVSVYKSQLKQSFAWNHEGRSDFIYTLVKKEINKLDYVKNSFFFFFKKQQQTFTRWNCLVYYFILRNKIQFYLNLVQL